MRTIERLMKVTYVCDLCGLVDEQLGREFTVNAAALPADWIYADEPLQHLCPECIGDYEAVGVRRKAERERR